MRRRSFVQLVGSASLIGAAPWLAPRVARAAPTTGYGNLLILVELKGGNDGLNTVVPYADPRYAQLRPRIAIARDQVLQLDARVGLHPSLAPLMPAWQARELAIIEGIGYPAPSLSHFRSVEIWDTGSRSDEYLDSGWLTRAFRAEAPPESFAAHGVIVGSPELGPLAGDPRAISIEDSARFARQARLATDQPVTGNAALAHILTVEREIVHAAAKLGTPPTFRTAFPTGPFGNAIRTAAEVAASRPGVAVIRVTLPGFDTHHGQPVAHARVLGQLAQGLLALKDALVEVDRWSSTLVVTYAEFGRRARENQSNGTDHGTASAHLAFGGRARGGLYGAAPALDRLDGNGNLESRVDFRSLYATVLERWWGLDGRRILSGSAPLDFLRA